MFQWGWSQGSQQQHLQQQPTVPFPHTSSINVTDASAQDNGRFVSEPQLMTMAPVQLEPEFSYTRTATVVVHLLAATYLTFQVGQSLRRAYRGLGPSQDTRHRVSRRNALLPVFSGLAVLSLSRAFYTAAQYATVSYKVWASQHDVELPLKFYGDHGVFAAGDNATPIYLSRWLSDTPVHLDAIEILAEKARRFWWGQQFDLALISWTMLLAIEGRRRNIPFLLSYQLLGQLVSLSFAQNLFFVALLLTPAPLPLSDGSLLVSRYVQLRNSIFPPKPTNWVPHHVLFTIVLGIYFSLLYLIPFFVSTPYLGYLVLSTRGASLLPLALSYIVPTSWGTTYTHHHDVYATYNRTFKLASAASFLLHSRALINGLVYTAPDAHHHRHSIYLPFDTEKRSAWEQTSSAFGRILGATSDHPVVSGVGWDVIISAVSIGCWAAARATEVSNILASSIPAYHGQGRIGEEKAAEEQLEEQEQLYATARGKAKVLPASSNAEESAGARRRGRPRKVKSEPDDKTYEPTPSELADTDEGDELPDGGLEWESAAVVWGLTALGGLGVGSAGAFGGECVAR